MVWVYRTFFKWSLVLAHFETKLKNKTKLVVILSLIPISAFHRLQEFWVSLILESSTMTGSEINNILFRYTKSNLGHWMKTIATNFEKVLKALWGFQKKRALEWHLIASNRYYFCWTDLLLGSGQQGKDLHLQAPKTTLKNGPNIQNYEQQPVHDRGTCT